MSRKLLAGTVLLGAGILTVVFGFGPRKSIYSLSVSAFVAHPKREQTVRVQGAIVPGSLCREIQGCGYRFRLADHWSALAEALPDRPRPQLSVHYPNCGDPDCMREVPGEARDVTVEGQLCANCHRFEASEIMSKCPVIYWVMPHEHHPVGTQAPLCTTHWGDG